MVRNSLETYAQATPLLLTVAVIELTDIAFAVGSTGPFLCNLACCAPKNDS